ncbi:hypothetical protein K6U06_02100 [Acidiferrimicrobium sp. IK]|uniref:TraR/DksA family transcriptional regulator n=1 Tax=Acidiferrimicrobium sp. IK TaxID=2871700 RepID=UPI0021CB2F40|nr:hypothetical protein [Acidiferrimicrobium sp. IK]MCU4183136.1 hypothetical protein [Acidiferrimicrobium sp. IK]
MDEIGHNGTPAPQPPLQPPAGEGTGPGGPDPDDAEAEGVSDGTGPAVAARRPDIEADLAVLGTIAGELDGIEAALGRIDKGAYGRCVTCGAPIDPAALEADPLLMVCAAHR